MFSENNSRRFFMILTWGLWRSISVLPVVAGVHFVMSINPKYDFLMNLYIWKNQNLLIIILLTALGCILAEAMSGLRGQIAEEIRSMSKNKSVDDYLESDKKD